jgi:hypothetical protein
MSLAHSSGTECSRGSDPEATNDPHAADCIEIHSGPDFVFCHREISPPLKRRWTEKVCRAFGIPIPATVDTEEHGLERFLNSTRTDGGEYLCALVHRFSTGCLKLEGVEP